MGIVQARTLEWVAISSSRGSSPPRDGAHVSHIAGRFITTAPPRKPVLCEQSVLNSYQWSRTTACLLHPSSFLHAFYLLDTLPQFTFRSPPFGPVNSGKAQKPFVSSNQDLSWTSHANQRVMFASETPTIMTHAPCISLGKGVFGGHLKLQRHTAHPPPRTFSCSSVSKLCPILCTRPHGLQHAGLPCPSGSLGCDANSCPLGLSWWLRW